MKFKLTAIATAVGILTMGSALAAEVDLEKLQADVDKLNAKAVEWEEWKAPKTLVHLAGYADVGYTDKQGEPGSFKVGTFSPIFHYQFSDIVMMEAELEFTIDETGKSEAGIDYFTVDYFISDYVALIGGKFLSPIGQFRQNLHPSWINRMASAPVGFGHDQAAPNAEIGLMFRGGFPVGGRNTMSYAAYIGNGPTFEADGGEIEGIETPGLNRDGDGGKVGGGRLGFYIPGIKLDLGASYATGKASVRTIDNTGAISYDKGRDYTVYGADLTWRISTFRLLGEYVSQEYGAQASSAAPDSGKWTAWYAQASYQFAPSKWEAVLRYGEYDTPHDGQDRNQSAVGVNYLFASNVVAKLDYEFNENPNPGFDAENRVLVQFAYGF